MIVDGPRNAMLNEEVVDALGIIRKAYNKGEIEIVDRPLE